MSDGIRTARWLTLLLLLGACGTPTGKKMDHATPLPLTTSLPARPADPATISSLRLVASPAGPQLAYATTLPSSQNPILRYATSLTLRPLAGGAPEVRLVELAQLLPPPPAWDLAALPSGGYELAIEAAGGALTALTWSQLPAGAPPQGADPGSSSSPLQSFAHPRFTRGETAAPSAPAALIAERGDELVGFQRPASGQPLHGPRPITAGERGVALPHRGGYLLFYKGIAPGPVRGADLSPGVLHALVLSSDLAPQGPPVRPLGEQVIYELDALSLEGRPFVVVTTPAGASLWSGGADPRALAPIAASERDRPLFSPSIISDGAGLLVAFLEDAGTASARFVHGAVRF